MGKIALATHVYNIMTSIVTRAMRGEYLFTIIILHILMIINKITK